MLHIGLIDYLNAFPFSWTLKQSKLATNWQCIFARPGKLNQQLAQGELHLSLVSAFEYVRHADQYLVAPNIALSSKGYVDSVRLVSSLPIEQLHEKPVHVTCASASSVAVLRILLGEQDIQPSQFIEYSCHDGVPANSIAALTIGDEALSNDFSRFDYSYDLGAEWQTRFKRDVVFALCVIRRDALPEYQEAIYQATQLMAQAPSQAFANTKKLETACQEEYPTISNPLEYLNRLHFEMGPEEIDNLNFFIELCAKHALIPKSLKPCFFEPLKTQTNLS